MIRLERPTQIPAPLRSAVCRQARRDADAWAQAQLAARRTKAALISQQAFQPVAGLIDAAGVVTVLERAQYGKCAFCEVRIVRNRGGSARFRPASGAVNLDGVSSLPHYAWNAYDWDNLHFSCAVCDRAKGLRFPVTDRRAPFGSRGVADLAAKEHALLLDPFVDEPDTHLVFTADGLVNSETPEGRATIDCFNLNRSELKKARARAVAGALRAWAAGDRDTAVAPDQEYAAARRQAVRPLAEQQASAVPSIVDEDEHVVVGTVRIRKHTAEQQQAAVGAESAAIYAQAHYSLDDRSADETYFATTKYIQAIEITDWKPVRRVRIDVPTGGSERAPWLVLLGENGSGKSSVLQGVALALLGQRGRDALGLRGRDYVRNGARRAEVKVWLTGVTEPCVLTARKGDDRFGGSENPKVLVLGYGATRLLPKRGAPPPSDPDAIADVDNLFDAFVPMTDANAWLLGLDDERFSTASRALKHLLQLKKTDGLIRFRSSGEVRCRALGSTVPLDRLSDGYQSVVALACDVLAVLLNRWTDAAAAEGIVVLDELGAHLHPRWRMLIVAGLRTLFPRVQFLVTTHDPLCLRGLEAGEVALVERRADKDRTVVVRQDLPSVAGLRADQLLTSEFFGLRSTVDPDIEKWFDEYYALLAERTPTVKQAKRIAALQDQLAEFRLLGDTLRERLVFESADLWLARRAAESSAPDERTSNAAAVSMLAEVWAARSPERFRGKTS